jgi:uncharacterized membrane protein
MGPKLQPALLGGLLIGVLSALPFVSAFNYCCCLWVIAGGVLTAYLLQERSTRPMTARDAALAGLLAGVIGAVIAAVVGGFFMAIMGGATQSLDQIPRGDLPPEFGRILDRFRELPPLLWYIGPAIAYLMIFPVFGMLGALLGVALFKRQPPPPPPGTVEILPPE